MDNAITIRNDKSNPVNKNIIRTFIHVEGMYKNRMCADVVIAENKEAKKHGITFLTNNGIRALSINGDHYQDYREKALKEFRSINIDVLVATDVVARGIDICDLEHVMIVELPGDFTTFIHRVGRIGRMNEGQVTTFYDPKKDYIFADEISNVG
uniref:Helicase C-terminal domain-containing protein n=1 Tax=Strongyloides papillosus TaxID=174720 RepID=A0A0N5CIB4_STREA